MERPKSRKKLWRSETWPLRWLCGGGYNIDENREQFHSQLVAPSESVTNEERPCSLGIEEDHRSTWRESETYDECTFTSSSGMGVKSQWSIFSPEFWRKRRRHRRFQAIDFLEESPQSQESGDVCSKEKELVPSLAVSLSSGFKPMCQSHQFLGPEGFVDVDLIDKSVNKYSVHFPTPGFYQWPATGLALRVRTVVTVTITFDSWSQHLAPDLQHHEQWMVAGPLFDISVEPGDAVAEIYIPHFISLPDGVDVSWFHVAHFKDEGMVLEPPARVEPFYAVLENPSFSLMGILLRIASGTRLSIPITSTTLIYYHWNPEDIKFHLYLIPSNASLTKAIDEEEARFDGVRLQSSPPVEALNFGSCYIVSCTANMDIIPKELKLSYRNAGEIQPFSKVYAGKMKKPIRFTITEKSHKTLVWETLVKPVDLQSGAASAPALLSGAAFVRKHCRQLQARLGELGGVLDDLQDTEVLTEYEKERVEQEQTRQKRNKTLLKIVERKGDEALDLLFRSISEQDPYLVSFLSQHTL